MELNSLAQRSLVEDILRGYLGGYSADRIYAGQIQRGDGDIIDAVILFCDLRGSSTLAGRCDLNGFIGLLNDYYDVTAAAVIKGGGEVLRYIGDASLTISRQVRTPQHRQSDRNSVAEYVISIIDTIGR